MASSRLSFGVLTFLPALILALLMPSAVHAQSPASAPAPTSDGTAIDQGIAYVLMFLALVLTYLIHSADVSGF
ncbi:arabinogalactan protein 41-like [Prosopis cineraria]|uniref:arabinogalactan protein 41-like n=1 Tax=Prosopis cineraria TaxID=364024 RepID=UPI00240EE349|nr:arabinogalactan protein 41-like [Prosopis cineraria]